MEKLEIVMPSVQKTSETTVAMSLEKWDKLFKEVMHINKKILEMDAELTRFRKLLAEGVEVYGYGDNKSIWQRPEHHDMHEVTHKALLISIQPIKKETAEDVLRDLINTPEGKMFPVDWLEKAKAVLDGNE